MLRSGMDAEKQKRRKRRQSDLKKREYRRLRNMVPSIAAKPNVSKVTVIEEAIRYINELHSALLNRLRTKGLPRCLQETKIDVTSSEGEIKEVVRQWVASSRSFIEATTSVSSANCQLERSRPLPSYYQRVAKNKHVKK